MDFPYLQKLFRERESNKKPKYKINSAQEFEILAKTVKLNEEVGELCNDILSVLKLQRKSKLQKFEKRNFYEEFADVILTTVALANSANVDLQRAINDKLKKLDKRQLEENNK